MLPLPECSDFQYPHIGSVRCNKQPYVLRISSVALSVPSHRVGSLQQDLEKLYDRLEGLSVPSHRVGSLQLACDQSCAILRKTFQYPHIGSVRCNPPTPRKCIISFDVFSRREALFERLGKQKRKDYQTLV